MCPILNSHMQVDLIAFMSLNGLMDDNGTQEDIAPKKTLGMVSPPQTS